MHKSTCIRLMHKNVCIRHMLENTRLVLHTNTCTIIQVGIKIHAWGMCTSKCGQKDLLHLYIISKLFWLSPKAMHFFPPLGKDYFGSFDFYKTEKCTDGKDFIICKSPAVKFEALLDIFCFVACHTVLQPDQKLVRRKFLIMITKPL